MVQIRTPSEENQEVDLGENHSRVCPGRLLQLDTPLLASGVRPHQGRCARGQQEAPRHTAKHISDGHAGHVGENCASMCPATALERGDIDGDQGACV